MGKEEEKKKGAVGEGAAPGDGKGAVVSSAAALGVAGKEGNGVRGAAAPGEEGKVYPPPLLPHEEVVGNPVVFGLTLRRFHSIMGTRFMIPVIGGKELDLHRLYVEVTLRGGLEKAIVERRWKEVIAAFKFPRTTTSASFVLKKYYGNLLHHFEQVHFHHRQGPLVPIPASLHAKSLHLNPGAPESSQQQIERTRKRNFSGMQSNELTSLPVLGTIDGKFEHGYMVTVKVGSETLHGVLYHLPSAGPSSSSAAAAYNVGGRVSRRRRRRRRFHDPAHPKPNRSAYNFFFADKHSKLKALYPNREREFSKMIGESWSKLTEDERTIYQDCGLEDKERYRREMLEYREKLKLSAVPGTQ